MAKLSDEEQRLLKQLSDKQKAPDTPPPSVNFTLDLSNDSAWDRAKQLGLIPGDNGKDEPEEPEDDETPQRRSYFGE